MTNKQINKRRIILCLDIDQTIFSHDCPESVLDYNGSDRYEDPSAWVNMLSEMKAYCEAHSFELVVQIVTAKSWVDNLVKSAFYALDSFLLPLNRYGKATLPFDDPTEGYASQDLPLYFIHHSDMVKRCRLKSKPETLVTEDALLPPIHICGYRSKASAMKYIRDHFHDETPAENIFLLDDQDFNLRDIQQPPYGYQGVSSYRLYDLEDGTKAERTIACHEILATLKNRIKARIDFILANELSNEAPACLPVSAPVSSVKPHEIHLAVKNNQLTRVQELAQQAQGFIHVEDAFKQTALLCGCGKRVS